MAKKIDDSGEVVKSGGKGRPVDLAAPAKPPRGFPFRLLFWAMLMTVAAGAGGYFTWKYRDKWLKEQSNASACVSGRDLAIKQAQDDATATCDGRVNALAEHSKEADAEIAKMSQNLNATKDELEQLRVQKQEAEKRIAAIEEIRKKFDEMTSAGDLKVTSRRGSLIVELPSEVLFELGQKKLSRKGEVAVLQVGGILKQFGDRRFLVVGHTDNIAPVKGSAFKDNWELSVERAVTVTRYLIEGGMEPKNVIAAGAGENDPIADNATSEGQSANRRIEIILLPALSELPPLPPSLDQKSPPK